MALALAAPAILLMIVLATAQYAEGQRRFATQLTAMTRALALATDRQIGQGQSVLQGLAVSPALATGDLKAFEAQARRAMAGRSAWIVLIGPDGQRINTLAAPGAPLPVAALPPERWAVVSQGRTTVSNLARGAVAGGPIIAIDMPVVVDGRLHDLAYIQRPAAFHSLLASQNLPQTWTGSVVDRNAALVARSHDQDKMLGRLASVDMRAAMAKSSEGVVRTHTLDGVKTLSAFSRSPDYGWTFIVGVPLAELNRVSLSGLLPLAAAAALMIALGVLAALLFAAPISRDVRALVVDAGRLAAGQPLEANPERLQEIVEVRRSMREASAQLRHREVEAVAARERQDLMINELNHRVKNTLVIVQSLARHSLRDGGQDGLARFNDRLHALARAHDLLTRRIWKGADLGELLAETLSPYGSQAVIDGPPVPLTPSAALALAMIFHELATNASKYGGLSAPDGKVELSWRALEDGRLAILWRESGGPPVSPPERTGFGSRLIAASLKGELAGDVTFDYARTGLICTIVVAG
jgi:two-component sensor histidine kinase